MRYVPVVLKAVKVHHGDPSDIGGFVTLQELSGSSDQRAVARGLLVPWQELRVGLTGVGLFRRLDYAKESAASTPWLAYLFEAAESRTKATGRTYVPALTYAFFRPRCGRVVDFAHGDSRGDTAALLMDLEFMYENQ